MEKDSKASLRNKISKKIESCCLDRDELNKLCQILQERSSAAGDIEVMNFKQGDMTDEQYENEKKLLKEAFELRVTVVGIDGEEIYGSIVDVFKSPNFPDQINTLYINSDTILKAVYNWYPRNSLEVFLDFGKPGLFDFSLMPSQPTPNASNFTVTGYDVTWVNGVFNEVLKFIEKRPSALKWIHKHTIYDFLLWIFGFPFGFWVAYKSSNFISGFFGRFSIFVQSAAYVYVFLASLFLLRILFHYARWICPMVEYRSQRDRSIKHRFLLGTIFLGLIVAILYDLIKFLL